MLMTNTYIEDIFNFKGSMGQRETYNVCVYVVRLIIVIDIYLYHEYMRIDTVGIKYMLTWAVDIYKCYLLEHAGVAYLFMLEFWQQWKCGGISENRREKIS